MGCDTSMIHYKGLEIYREQQMHVPNEDDHINDLLNKLNGVDQMLLKLSDPESLEPSVLVAIAGHFYIQEYHEKILSRRQSESFRQLKAKHEDLVQKIVQVEKYAPDVAMLNEITDVIDEYRQLIVNSDLWDKELRQALSKLQKQQENNPKKDNAGSKANDFELKKNTEEQISALYSEPALDEETRQLRIKSVKLFLMAEYTRVLALDLFFHRWIYQQSEQDVSADDLNSLAQTTVEEALRTFEEAMRFRLHRLSKIEYIEDHTGSRGLSSGKIMIGFFLDKHLHMRYMYYKHIIIEETKEDKEGKKTKKLEKSKNETIQENFFFFYRAEMKVQLIMLYSHFLEKLQQMVDLFTLSYGGTPISYKDTLAKQIAVNDEQYILNTLVREQILIKRELIQDKKRSKKATIAAAAAAAQDGNSPSNAPDASNAK